MVLDRSSDSISAVRRMTRTAGFGAATALVLPAFRVHQAAATQRDQVAIRDLWLRAWAKVLLSTFAVTVVTSRTASTAPALGGRLVVSNHRSAADIPVLLREFGGCMVSRADLARWALIGPWARAVGTIFVDRNDPASGANAIRSVERHLAQGATVTVFPEGTTFADDVLRPFQIGAFIAAARAKAPIIPVGLAYESGSGAAFGDESFPAHLSRMAAAGPSRVALSIGAQIEPRSATKVSHLRDAARTEVERMVEHARRVIDSRS